MRTNASGHRSRRGQAMVETALVLLLLLGLIIGALDVAQVLMHIQFMTARARQTARWAATHSFDAAKIKAYAVYGDPASTATGPGILGLEPEDIQVTLAGTPNTASHRITIRISKQLALFSPYLPRTITPNAAIATAPVESLGGTGGLTP